MLAFLTLLRVIFYSEWIIDEKETIHWLHRNWVCSFRLWAGCRAAAAISRSFCVGAHEQSCDAGGKATSAGDGRGVGRRERALLDQYCVTCHNDRTKRANLSLEKLDLDDRGRHPELWEKVVRKLRAGVMPPPGREAAATWLSTRRSREWLEA